MSTIEFRLLGPVEMLCGGSPVPLGGPRDQAIVAALLLDANRVVPLDQLVVSAWGDGPPSTARVQAQNRISRLRRALASVDAAGMVVTSAGGYRIEVRPDQLDVHRFSGLVGDADALIAAGDLDKAATVLADALSLWRGPALDGLGAPALVAAAQRLEESRMRALEKRIEVELVCGRNAELASELTTLTHAYPYRERLSGYLMLALHRAGRRGEALEVFRATRALLAEQLGIEPGRDLQRLHEAILRGDEDGAQASAIHVIARPDQAITTRAPALAGASGPLPVPRQLPADVPIFTGRKDQLDRLDQLLASGWESGSKAVVISAIAGTAGVGKTSLAVHWAHQVADRFPDGQLYVNLRGFDPGGTVVTPAEAVRGFLDALHVPASRIPVNLEAQVGLYRSLLADRNMLIVLDNARDADQVRPLLPGAPGCLVLVTSRNSLSGLVASEGAYPLTLDLLSRAEARQFLAHRLGAERVAAEGQAVDEIIDSCARLPLALAVVAARAATHPHLPLATLASELRESRDRLDMLAGSEATTDVRAVFSWSYLALSAPAARLFRLLGIHPGPDTTARAAASLAGIELGQARRLLAELTRAHLVAEHRPGRYRSHDLLRVYATELTDSHDSAADRHAAALRMLDHYLHSAVAADGMLDSSRPSLPLASVQPGVVLDRPDDQRAALAWFAAERQVLMAAASFAADHGQETHCWQLAWALETVLDRLGHWQDLTTTLRTALEAVRRLADRAGEARIHRGLARAYARIDRHEDAHDHLRRALRLYQEDGDHIGQASAHRNIAYVYERQARYRDALAHEQQAFALFEAANDKAGQARCLNGLGWYHALLGEYEQGVDYCQRALSLHEPTNVHAQAVTWDSLGYAHHKLGRHRKAIACYQRALDLYRETGDRLYEAGALRYVGDCHHAAGDTDTAREEWQRALSILEELNHSDAEQLRSRLTATTSGST